jgi:hypothetical protein
MKEASNKVIYFVVINRVHLKKNREIVDRYLFKALVFLIILFYFFNKKPFYLK